MASVTAPLVAALKLGHAGTSDGKSNRDGCVPRHGEG